MVRQPRPTNPDLERLLEERDHIRIQISLAEHSDLPNPKQLSALLKKLSELDQMIKQRTP
jgi:hypothetical protein